VSAPNESRRLLITGQVQGVGFRYSMQREAQHLGVSGWVRNRRDGSVEANICGSAEAVAALIAWSRQGPPGASVEHVHVEIGAALNGDFELFPTF
jgi:acylphosphatase